MNDTTTPGMLYLCATPIGNLSDITERVKETLADADIIAAEDTRNSLKLLNHFDIKTPLTSYHEHNKYDKAKELIEMMRCGKNVALVTDAGTPAISDPGQVLTDMCHKEGIRVTSLPGPCALITALTLSGFDARRFVFDGFLPPEKKERREVLGDLKNETRTIIIYEAPHHLKNTLSELQDALGDRNIAICRELTKKFEEVKRMTLLQALSYYDKTEPKGEYVLIIDGKPRDQIKREQADKWNETDINEHMAMYESRGIERREAMKMVAADRGVTKREIYGKLLEQTDKRSN